MKPKFSMGTLSDNVDNAKSCQRKLFIIQFAAEKNSSPDRKDIYIIKEDKNLLALISLILIQYIQKIIFLKKVCLRFGFLCQVSVNKKRTTMNKNVRFISGNFSSERFSWKVKTMWSIYFNQQTPTVLVFRIYHTETHVTNICWNLNKFLTGVQAKTFCLRSSQMIMKQNFDK